MLKPGDVVVANFVGAVNVKRRPAVVLSSDAYHANRPDYILGLITTQVAAAMGPTDYLLQDWASAVCVSLLLSAHSFTHAHVQTFSRISAAYPRTTGRKCATG